ncbi:DUF262 domain-containing protein [Dietzia sp. CH92]|uniref:DUF262 domain-containing protein n=1 Tax=Dietzia sp. CH92 TaxID=3051823 RepID=UPI0028D505CF|nr:DUF262 domain-containing protein [Dietzia sp. CH92]
MRGATEIYKVYEGRSKTLHIPVYQRNYDWSIPQCTRLFDDLEATIRDDRPKHFFGAVVGKPEGTFEWIVIDGQQRLTTVSILTLALVNAAKNGVISFTDKTIPTKIERDFLLVDDDATDEVKVKLKPVKDDDRAYRKLFGPTADYVETSNITANYRYFLKRLAETELSGDEVWNAICRLEVMLCDLEPHDDPQRIFESLNSTGLSLTEGDKIRNLVLMDLPRKQQQRIYEDFWNPIEKLVWHKTDWYIRWYLVTTTGKTPKKEEVYTAFRKYISSSRSTISQILEHMHTYAKYTRAIQDAKTGFPQTDQRLSRFNAIKGDVVLPYLLPLVEEVHLGTTTDEQLSDVISILESYLYRRITCSIGTNALNKIFATLYGEARRLRTASQPHPDLLIYLLQRRDGSGRFPDDDEFLSAFKSRNSYALRGKYQQYLFDCLENRESKDVRDVAGALEAGTVSIEHIMPQKLTQSWRNELGDDAEETHQTWLHRIGNLTVTGYNPSYSNSPFERKKTMKNGIDDSPYRLNNYLKEVEKWGPAELEERSRQLASIAQAYWSYPHTNFRPPAAVLPSLSLGEGGTFRGRTLVAYEFGDVKETVESWADMLPRLISVLLQHSRKEVMEHAGKSTNYIVIESDSQKIPNEYRKVDEGLAVYTSSSTDAKIRLLRALFDDLDIDPEELVFTFRPDKNEEAENLEETANLSPFAPLTKFADRFDELCSQTVTPEDTAEIRVEFVRDFAPFQCDDPVKAMCGKMLPEFENPHVVGNASTNQVLAAISATIQASQFFDPLAFHNKIASGVASLWLWRLVEISKAGN